MARDPPDTLEQLRAQLLRHEGLKLRPYKDSVGKLTIGVGRNLDDIGISYVEAVVLLDHDVERTIAWLLANHGQWFTRMTSERQAAIINMVFNLGPGGFSTFQDAIAALEAGDYPRAAGAMLQSKWARQVGLRAAELAGIIRTGAWPSKM